MVNFDYMMCNSTLHSTDKCISIIPSSLKEDTTYSLELPVGSRISNYSGITQELLSVTFSGLFPFRFPFVQEIVPRYHNYTLLLRHGLSHNTSLDVLEKSISIIQENGIALNFTLSRPSKAYISLEGNYLPSTNYTITVLANPEIRDGFGLPLLSSSTYFTTAPALSLVVQGSSNYFSTKFDNDYPSNWTIFSRNPYLDCGITRVQATNINRQNLLLSIASSKTVKFISYMEPTMNANLPLVTNGDIDITLLPTASLFGDTGLWLNEEFTCGWETTTKNSYFVSSNDFGVSVLTGSDSITVWVTKLNENDVVRGATVTIYAALVQAFWQDNGITANDFSVLGSGNVDWNGMITFKNVSDQNTYRFYVVVENDGKLDISGDFFLQAQAEITNTLELEADLITDRGFYKPGDKLYVKGYIRYLNTLDNTIELPKEESWILSIQWSNADTTSTTYTIYLNEWGTFNTTIEIPLDSSFGPKTLFAFSENYTYSTSVEILIAEPRIPTALLKMSTTDKIKIPGRALPIQIELDTYTGQGIEGAPISITWTLTRSTPSYFLEGYFYGIRGILPPSSTTSETGNMMVYTGINGKIEFNLTLQLNNMEEEGNTLTILAEYFSLTKELLTQTINLEVAYTQLALSLTTTVEEGLIIIPGYDFGVLGLVQDITNGNTVENISVEITLYNWEGTLALVYLGVGVFWQPSDLEIFNASDISLQRLLQNTESLSTVGKAALALALLSDNVQQNIASSLLTSILSTVRIQGRTAYITEPHSQNPSLIGTAIALEGYILSRETNPIVEQLANFVAQQRENNEVTPLAVDIFPIRYTSFQVSHIMLSLAMYDEWKGNSNPNLEVSVESGELVLLKTNITSLPYSREYLNHIQLGFESLPYPRVNFSAVGTGEASIVFGTNFVPLALNLSPIYRGISVKKVIQLYDLGSGQIRGGSILNATIGETVKVTIEITIPDWSQLTVIVDPFPGAIEPFDVNIYGFASSNTPHYCVGSYDYFCYYIYNAFAVQQFETDKVVFYGQNLFPGTHTVSYLALVNTEGIFVNPPSLAYDDFQPELMGLSAGSYFVTKNLNNGTLVSNQSCL